MDKDIKLTFTAPRTRVGIGALSFDPLERFLGFSLRELLAPLAVSEPYISLEGDVTMENFPIRIPAGEGLDINTKMGAVGFRNAAGQLAVNLPALFGVMVKRSWASWIDHEHVAVVNGQRQTTWHIRTAPGATFQIPLGPAGRLAFTFQP